MTQVSRIFPPSIESKAFLAPLSSATGESSRDALIRWYHTDPILLRKWLSNVGKGYTQKEAEELIIGGGLHGTTYAVNNISGSSLVYDQSLAFPSVFGESEIPAFYLNSRNRPEAEIRQPSTPGPLNSIIGGILQPSEFNLLEYQTQTDLAYAIRLNLAAFATVVLGVKVVRIERNLFAKPFRYKVTWSFSVSPILPPQLGCTYTNRIILAPGLGRDRMPVKASQRVMSFTQFLRSLSKAGPHPFRGFRRVAIVGAGDSGKVVAEALLGLGPQIGYSNAAEDFVERLVWVGQNSLTKEEWEGCERSRYLGLGRSFPRRNDPNYYYRIQPEPGRAVRATGGSKSARLDWTGPDGPKSERFDYVIVCAGFENTIDSDLCSDFTEGTSIVKVNGIAVARQYIYERIFVVGPAAELELEEDEITPKINVPENIVAAFRYVGKTALFARTIKTAVK